ncbi:MAG: cysteine synthase family protein [Cyanobacteria bacterium SZAS LIN-3]|nr:cysteine synthase family protein [Cyanobacteria bacterium SZAS LIN-3]
MNQPCELLTDNCRFVQQIAPTPLVPVALEADGPRIWCKLEFLNPSGSTKDRIARYILEKQWRLGRLRTGSLVVEASSGSTSIAMALVCAQIGLKFIAVMPESVSNERVQIIKSYGGQIILTPRADGILGALSRAAQEAEERDAFYPRQFENVDNAEAHRVSTGQEILGQVPGGVVHAVVSGVGTGGTIVGLYNAFAGAGCPVRPVFAKPVETVMAPAGQTYFEAECCSFSSRVPGVVDGLSKLYSRADLPGLIEVEVQGRVAIETTRKLIRHGFPVGPSSGLNYAAAVEAQRQLGDKAHVVTVFPDRMERYFSTELFSGWQF